MAYGLIYAQVRLNVTLSKVSKFACAGKKKVSREIRNAQNRLGGVEILRISRISRISRKIGLQRDPHLLPRGDFGFFGYGLIGICEILRCFCQIGSLAQSSLSAPHIMGG